MSPAIADQTRQVVTVEGRDIKLTIYEHNKIEPLSVSHLTPAKAIDLAYSLIGASRRHKSG
jgi:hypothetical protein